MYTKISEKTVYNAVNRDGKRSKMFLVRIICDTVGDMPEPLPDWLPGSQCDVLIDGGSSYLLSNSGEWMEVINTSQGGGGSGEVITELKELIALKQDAEPGKQLSEENFTAEDKAKLDGISGTTIPEMQNIMRELVNSGQKNLVDLSRLSDRTFSGFELKNNGDGSLTLNGSRTSSSNLLLIGNINAGVYDNGDQFQLQCLKDEGEYVVDTTSFPLKLGFQIFGSDDGKTLTSLLNIDGGKKVRFTLNQMYKFIWFRLLVYGNSVFDNVTVFPAVYKAELYDLDQSFQKYAMSNAELTEQISELSDRIKTLEPQSISQTSKTEANEMMEERSDERTNYLE